MTKETRILVDLRDILGVEIACPGSNCKAKILFPINGNVSKLNHACFQCGEPWFGASLSPQTGGIVSAAVQQIHKLMDTLNWLSTDERSDIHAPIRLHIGGLADEVSVRASGEKD
jgi:hypothetical protein